MRHILIIFVICASLSACVTRRVNVSEPFVSTSVEDSLQQRRQQQRIKKRLSKPHMRESNLYFDDSQATLSLRVMVAPASDDNQRHGGDSALKETAREVVSSYQILIQSRNHPDLMIESIALKSSSQSFFLPVSSINSAEGISFYVDIVGEQAAKINSNENYLLAFSYQGRTISAVIVQHQLSNIIESLR